ncbi:MAG: hypothetical protein JWP02_2480, partial [Acidimicrobiales bacterium]|nr:hypothetical protein [Acidimicrobiales bacterium]
MAADADDRAFFDDDLIKGEALTHLGARVGGGVDEDLVEHRSARRVPGRDAVTGSRRARDRERPEVERV